VEDITGWENALMSYRRLFSLSSWYESN